MLAISAAAVQTDRQSRVKPSVYLSPTAQPISSNPATKRTTQAIFASTEEDAGSSLVARRRPEVVHRSWWSCKSIPTRRATGRDRRVDACRGGSGSPSVDDRRGAGCGRGEQLSSLQPRWCANADAHARAPLRQEIAILSRRAGFTVAASLLVAAATAGAQVQPPPGEAASHPLRTGTYIIGGGASVTSSALEGLDGRQTSIQLRPSVSRFVTPRWAIGTSAVVGYASSGGGSATTIGIGPVVHRYFGGAADRVLPFVSVATRLERTSFRGADRATTSVGVDGDLGATYLLVPHVGVSGSLFYQYSRLRLTTDQTRSSNTVGARFGLTVFVH